MSLHLQRFSPTFFFIAFSSCISKIIIFPDEVPAMDETLHRIVYMYVCLCVYVCQCVCVCEAKKKTKLQEKKKRKKSGDPMLFLGVRSWRSLSPVVNWPDMFDYNAVFSLLEMAESIAALFSHRLNFQNKI